MSTAAPPRRLIVVGVVRSEAGEYLICKMPPRQGVFPGQWGLPGGGVEEGESLEEALRRELREELRTEVRDIVPLFFSEGTHQKSYPDGRREELYMVFLLYECVALTRDVVLNDEFTESAWVARKQLAGYDLNAATRATFARMGLL